MAKRGVRSGHYELLYVNEASRGRLGSECDANGSPSRSVYWTASDYAGATRLDQENRRLEPLRAKTIMMSARKMFLGGVVWVHPLTNSSTRFPSGVWRILAAIYSNMAEKGRGAKENEFKGFQTPQYITEGKTSADLVAQATPLWRARGTFR